MNLVSQTEYAELGNRIRHPIQSRSPLVIVHSVDSDCNVPYLTLAKSTRLPILLCKLFNLAGVPKRTVGYLRTRTIPHC